MNEHEKLVQKLQFQEVWYELTVKPMIEKERLDNDIFYSSMSWFVKEFNRKFVGILTPIRYQYRIDSSVLGIYPRYIHILKSDRWELIGTDRTQLFCDLVKEFISYKPVIKLLFKSFEDCKERFSHMLNKGENLFLTKYMMDELIND